ncbi:MAG: hypothetical protein CL581_16395 [Alteromonadaceae bacterium]|nr:hypothetical protein [Alteromonadaceae bacterium]
MSEDTPKKKKAPAKKAAPPVECCELGELAKGLILHVDKMFDDLFAVRNGIGTAITQWETARRRSLGRGTPADVGQVVTVIRRRVDDLAERIREDDGKVKG